MQTAEVSVVFQSIFTLVFTLLVTQISFVWQFVCLGGSTLPAPCTPVLMIKVCKQYNILIMYLLSLYYRKLKHNYCTCLYYSYLLLVIIAVYGFMGSMLRKSWHLCLLNRNCGNSFLSSLRDGIAILV